MTALLTSFLVVNDQNEKQLHYYMNGKEVCKCFFKSALAIPTKMFNSCVAFVLDRSISNTGAASCDSSLQVKQRSFKKTNEAAYVVAFLDTFFKSKGKRKMVDTSPNATGYMKECYTIRMKWTQLWSEHYGPLMRDNQLNCASYDKFCELRALHRPLYIRHRKVCTY
jgi:hypothetical protein